MKKRTERFQATNVDRDDGAQAGHDRIVPELPNLLMKRPLGHNSRMIVIIMAKNRELFSENSQVTLVGGYALLMFDAVRWSENWQRMKS